MDIDVGNGISDTTNRLLGCPTEMLGAYMRFFNEFQIDTIRIQSHIECITIFSIPRHPAHAVKNNGMKCRYSLMKAYVSTPEELAECRANLLKYCGLDTFAMVRVLEKLQEVAG